MIFLIGYFGCKIRYADRYVVLWMYSTRTADWLSTLSWRGEVFLSKYMFFKFSFFIFLQFFIFSNFSVSQDEGDQLATIIELLGIPPQKLLDQSKRARNFVSSKVWFFLPS